MATEKAKIIRNKIKYDTRTIALSAILIAAALVLSLVESWIPIMVSIPGIRLGLANIATVFAIYVLGPVPSVVVVVLRCLLGAIFSGTFSAFAFSLCGGLFAFLAMWVLSMNRHISPIGVCVGGAAAHSIGQILAAMLVLGSKAPIAYLPVLMLISVVTGLITGVISELVLCALSNTTVIRKRRKSHLYRNNWLKMSRYMMIMTKQQNIRTWNWRGYCIRNYLTKNRKQKTKKMKLRILLN